MVDGTWSSGAAPWRTTFRIPLTLHGGLEGGCAAPLSFTADLIAAVRSSGRWAVPDPQSLRIVEMSAPAPGSGSGTPGGAVPVQFTPEFLERLPLDAPGDPSWICRFPVDLGAPEAPAVVLRGTVTGIRDAGWPRRPALECDVFDAAAAVQLPYPPNTFRILLPDGRVPAAAFSPAVTLTPQAAGRMEVRVGAAHFCTYVYQSAVPKPYFFPVVGPSGDRLTRLGHPHDPTESHRHHRSLWIAHGDVNGVDFWHGWRPGAGAIRHRRFAEQEQGPVFARLVEDLDWQAPDGTTLLAERRTLTVYGPVEGIRLLDVDCTLTANRGVTLGRTPFGFLALRVAQSMTPYDGGGVIRNAEGRYNDDLCLRPSVWADASGPVGQGRWAGIAVLGHRENPRHAAPFYCRNDGWLGAAYTGLEPLTLPEGATLPLRYRLVVHDGPGTGNGMAAAYRAYTQPPAVALAGPAVYVGRSQLTWPTR